MRLWIEEMREGGQRSRETDRHIKHCLTCYETSLLYVGTQDLRSRVRSLCSTWRTHSAPNFFLKDLTETSKSLCSCALVIWENRCLENGMCIERLPRHIRIYRFNEINQKVKDEYQVTSLISRTIQIWMGWGRVDYRSAQDRWLQGWGVRITGNWATVVRGT